MTATTINVADGSFHVDDTGGTGPVIVCLHSLFTDNRMFDDFAVAAADTFRVVRPDSRGQGRSSAANGDVVTIEQCAGDMAAVIDALDIERAHLLVSSMGGDVALNLAAFRPELVTSMAIVGSSARAEPDDQLEAFTAWVDDVGEKGFTGDRLDFVVQVMFGESTRSDPTKSEMTERWIGRLGELPKTLKPAMTGVVARRDANPLLRHISVPTLVMSGRECIVRPPEWAHELADGLPNAELEIIPEVGHSPILEAPVHVTRRVLEFFWSQA